MPDRYWVGGTANWDGTTTANWSATDGGPSGASVPTAADAVFFTALSGAGTVTVTSNRPCLSLNFTGFTGTFNGGLNQLAVSGSVTFNAVMTAFTSNTIFRMLGTGTFISAGQRIGQLNVDAAGITVTLGDALTCNSALSVSQGTFTTANFNVTASALVSSGGTVRTANLGSSTVTLTGSSALSFGTNTNLTFNAGTSTISCSNASVVIIAGPVSGAGVTFHNLSFTNTEASTHAIQASSTFNNLTVAAPSTAGVTQVTFDSRQTINGTLSTTGTAGNRRVWFRGVTYGLAQTLTCNSAASLTDADFRDIYVIGTAAPISGTRVGDLRGCGGITFSTPKTVFWNLAGAQNWSANGWAATSTGTPSTDNFPLAQDTATFTNAGSVTGTITMNSAIPYTGTVDMSGRTSAMTLSIGTGFTIYGNWTNGSGTTLSGTSTLTFSGRNTQTITSAGKTFNNGWTIDTYGGSVELADALTISANPITITNGTFDTKNYNVTTTQIASNNSNVRTITLGSSTLTLSSTQPITFTTSVNLTLNAGTSQINATSTSGLTFAGGGLVFNNVSFTGASAFTYTINNANTFNNLTITPPASASIAFLEFLANNTITGTLTCAGASAVRRIWLRSNTLGTTRTLTVGTLSATDCDFRDITIAGAAAGSSPTRAGNCGGNTGINFPAPKTVYWNLAGTQNWSANGWAPSSGGTPAVDNFPLAQDTAVFDNAGAAGAVTIERTWNIGTFDASLRTSAMTLNSGTDSFIYGDWKFGTGVTSGNSGSIIIFAGRGTEIITSNGVTFNCPITVNCVTGTIQLADALTIASTRALTLTSGTFDAVTYNVTTGSFVLNSGTLRMGTGTWTLSGTGTVWNMGTPSAFYKGTANIVLSDTSTSARSFDGAGLSYNKLTIGGATGTSTTTINGNNQFTELASTKTVAHTIALGSTTQTFGRWTVTGTVGNVVTLTGTGTSHILAGACTSGIDYLAMGSIGFAATSPGEFYAGANSTGTAGAPVYRTAKPADSIRYWVGGTGNWSDTNRWSTGSGGGGGASVPRSHDDVVFDAASNATAYTATVNAVTGGIRCKSLTIAGPASGNLTLAGSTAIDGIHGNVTFPATGLTRTYTGAITLSSNSTGRTFTTNGQTLASAMTINGVDCGWSLGSALNNGSSSITVTNGSFNLATYNLTASAVSSNNAHSRTINFSTGTATLNDNATAINFGTTETNRANLTVTSSTSQINCTSASGVTFTGNNQTFNNVSFTDTGAGTITINGANTFNNLSFTGITSVGLRNIALSANQTVTGTLTFSAGTNATMRHFVRSDTIGTTRTITAAAFSGTDVDFQDITIAGAAAPVSGTRLGNCAGNSGITFPAAKTVYWNLAAGGNWSATAWATGSSSGTPAVNNFPLAQDTAIIENTGLNTSATVTVNANWNIGTINMSNRTNAMTLSNSSSLPTFYGNWINGSGTTLTGAGTFIFSGRTPQTITSAGKTFTQTFVVDSLNGSVTLQDAITIDRSSSSALTVTRGTFDANGYNVTLSGASSGVDSSNTNTRTIAVGSGTWTIAGSNGWSTGTSTNLTVTGTGTISLTSGSAKTFAGGGVAYTNIALDQGGAGTLTITGNNTLKDITNSVKSTSATTINIGTTTQRLSQFTAAGEAGRVLTFQGSSASSPGTLILSSGTVNSDYLTITGVRAYPLTTTWYAGTNSTNNGSLGWIFDSGVVVISAAVSETASGADAISALVTFTPSVSETASGADVISSLQVFLADISEAGTAADLIDAARAYLSEIAESAAGSDLFVATFSPLSSVDETASGADSVAATADFAASVSESGTIADLVDAAKIFLASISETATGADVLDALAVFLSAISEISSGSDSVAVAASTFNAAVSEAATQSDIAQAFVDFVAAVSETASGADAVSAQYTTNPFVSETASGADSITAVFTAVGQIAETATGTDSIFVAPSTFNAVFTDASSLADSVSPPGSIYNAPVVLSATIADALVGRRLWEPIDDIQTANWQNVNTLQSAGWTPVTTGGVTTWVKIDTTP